MPRAKREKGLLQTTGFYETILDSVVTGVWVTDRDDVIRYANRGMGEIAGIPTTAIVGARVMHDFSEGALRYFRPKYLEAKEALRPVRYDDLPVVTPSGKESLQSGWLIPRTSNGDFDGIICTVEDVTERKVAEEALRDSEERLRLILDNARDAIFWADADTGLIIKCNKAGENLLEKEESEIIGHSQATIHPPQKAGYYMELFGRHLQAGGVIDEEAEVATRSGRIVPVLISASITSVRGQRIIQGIFRDITERKHAEEALRESESRYRALAENSLAGIFVSDARRFIYVNPRLCEITGFSEAELMNMRDPLGSLLVPDERERLMAYARSRLDGKAAPAEYDARGLRKDGAEIVLRLAVSAVELSGTRVLQGTVEDITERRQVEEELAKHRDRLEELVEERTKELWDAQEELVRKERLAFLGELAGGVGHELRNPLGAIKNVAYYLRMALKQPEPRVAESLNQMDRAVTRADGIISSLLGFAGQRPPTLLGGNVNDAVREALSQVEAPENVQVATRLDDTLPRISLDAGQMGQVFENLIVNAVQAMVDGGRLTVRSECSGAGWVAVSFADTGAGLSPEDLAKVFQPLFTTRASGIGLGLAISKTIVEAHGGSIEAQSKLGAGSTFTVRLPARSEGE